MRKQRKYPAESCHEHARVPALSCLRMRAGVVTNPVEAESCFRWSLVSATLVPLFPCFDGFFAMPFLSVKAFKNRVNQLVVVG